jgi:hypothetical protein
LLQLSLLQPWYGVYGVAPAVQEECQDLPWKDVDGDTCQDYSKEGWCGAQWNKGFEDPGVKDPRGKTVTAEIACCACGGGHRVPIVNLPVHATAQAPVTGGVPPPVAHRSHLPVASSSVASPNVDIADKIAQGVDDSSVQLPHFGSQDLHRLVKKVKQRLKSREHKVAAREAKLAKREEKTTGILSDAQKAKQRAEEKAKAAETLAEAAKRNATAEITHANEKAADSKRALAYAVAQRNEESANLSSRLHAAEEAEHNAEREAELQQKAADFNYTMNLRLAKEAKELREKLRKAQKQLQVEHVEREAAMSAAKTAEAHISEEKNRAAKAIHAKMVAEEAAKQAENQTAQLEQQMGELKWSSENADEQAGEFLRKTRKLKEKAMKERDEARKDAEQAKKEALANMTAHKKAAGQAEAWKEQLKQTESRLKEEQAKKDAAAQAVKRAETKAHKVAQHHAKVLKQKDLEREAAVKAAERAEANVTAHVAANITAERKAEALKAQLRRTQSELKHTQVKKEAAAAAAKRAEAKAHKATKHHGNASKHHGNASRLLKHKSAKHEEGHANTTKALLHANKTKAVSQAKDKNKKEVPHTAPHATRHMKVKATSTHGNHTKVKAISRHGNHTKGNHNHTNHTRKGF